MSATIPDAHQENSVAHNEELASRVRTALAGRKDVEEKKMFGGHHIHGRRTDVHQWRQEPTDTRANTSSGKGHWADMFSRLGASRGGIHGSRVLHISRPSQMPHALAFVDWMMRALHSTTLDAARKLQTHVVLHGFIQGLAVNVDAEARAVADSRISEADYMREQDETFRRIADGGQFPYFAR
jgi:hypothetical protein